MSVESLRAGQEPEEIESSARRAEALRQIEFLRNLAKDRFVAATPTNAPGGTALGLPPEQNAPLTYGVGRVSPIQGGIIAGLSEDQWFYGGFWAQIVSSNVAAIAYNYETMDLLVEFLNGSVYRYMHVQESVARDFWRASSPGKFVWARLRDRYSYLKLK